MDGIFNINKPSGSTSFGIVSLIKRISGERRVGHAGTLDPTATGVLPVCLGQGTRITEFLVDTTKTYRAEIELGISTDTYDASGRVTQQCNPAGIGRAQLDSALGSFSGLIEQRPPLYSALKYQGVSLYKLARAGIAIEPRSRLVRIYHLELIDWQPPKVTVEIVCGKGTYIRSLAHDLGQVLGCGACLKSLSRLRCGPFDIGDAISLQQLERAFRCGYWQQLIYAVDSVLSHWTAMVVGDDEERNVRNGRPIVLHGINPQSESSNSRCRTVDRSSAVSRCRAYARDGTFLGVLCFNSEKGEWRPQKVFPRYPSVSAGEELCPRS
jgi:tRNA pseudouridine55 synthase